MFNELKEDSTFLFTSESVGEGHPDKLCDIISDSVLDAFLEQDPFSRVACETAIKNNKIFLFGEITSKAEVNLQEVVKKAVKSVGYTSDTKGLDYKSCSISPCIELQSLEIAQGIHANTHDLSLGAGDQGMMFGYAVDETESCMPLTIDLSHQINLKIKELGKNYPIGPDCKSQVTMEYQMVNGRPIPLMVKTVVISVQHEKSISLKKLRELILDEVVYKTIPLKLMTLDTKFLINPCGSFHLGGPVADAGLTGRKIIVDTYGGWAPHGGGAFSGKDCTKVDRSAAYAARQIAKSLVTSKICSQALVQLSYAIGIPEPVSISVFSFGTSDLSNNEILDLIKANFDLRPAAIINQLNLREPAFRPTASFGHFGNPQYAWEKPIALSPEAKAMATASSKRD